MTISGNTILITGGSTGIGLELAASFLQEGNQVVICGRRPEKLEAAKEKYPSLNIVQADISDELERERLIEWMQSQFPNFNMLVNNAGIQVMADFKNGADRNDIINEIATNFEAPVHLSSLCIPYFSDNPESAIINITSGLAFIPLSIVPVYCATKAALHSFTLSLRQQLLDTSTRVFEIAPPIVDTDLDKGAREERGLTDRGIPASQVAEETIKAVAANQFELHIGLAENLYQASKSPNEETVFKRMNSFQPA